MGLYSALKQFLTRPLFYYKNRFFSFNTKMNSRTNIKELIKKNSIQKLQPNQIKEAKSYYKSKGIKLNNTYWHSYYTHLNKQFHPEYIPEDIFRSSILPKFNEMRQWPALVDKNLYYILFKDFNQPKRIIQNINGFYYIDNIIINEELAIDAFNATSKPLIIKPTIDSGRGNQVEIFTMKNKVAKYKNLRAKNIFKMYNKDFIIQEFVDQSQALKELNPSSLNTIRIMTYLRPDGVYVLSSVLKVGKAGSPVDNYACGGIIIGIDSKGYLSKNGYLKNGEILTKTHTDIVFEGFRIPNYASIVKMAKTMHPIVPYFKFVSWDIGLDNTDSPIFIEYNTYNQNIDIHQITNGPLFGKFSDEIIKLGLEAY